MNLLKKRLKSKEFLTFMTGVILAVIYTAILYEPYFLYNLVNFLFVLGIYHILLGLCVYVRNVGLFKVFGHAVYKRNFRRHGRADPSARPMSLSDYTEELYKNQKPLKEYFIIGVPVFILSYVIAIIGSRL